MTTNDPGVINDMIETCDLVPSEDVTRRLLDILESLNTICESLNARIDELKRGHCQHNVMVETGFPENRWRCAHCGYLYSRL